ncbi:NADH-quinone oxidoreductase subunit N [Desulfovibrio sulfodismutans]|uniref:NADH-quinone oxidoreductase subunit N n=1 Tax=Desulfolutivibrio sulfodismutans TaxID=63561 RepID=A0A7K3NGH4_9BACT|nr:NADH-quinone oxidoreductase subunit N [Desulfolutivibrio sulfodismutans]NDY55294.1 NADH-quinone oxidoreductase subunit N [Desulfolutivibrio sulfodismutans]QLA12677.1 NADH-quinone oxidoreductase subunit NuoN [Desulfolutivibrio sulfodismutans DSM 3696]
MNFDLVMPELFQLLVVVALFVQSVVRGRDDTGPRWLPVVAIIGVVVAASKLGAQGVLFEDVYRVDALSQFFKVAISLGFCVTVINAQNQPTLETQKRTDYFMMLSLSAWGLMLLASAAELITLYLALELSSYSLYALIPLRGNDRRASEAAIKYILFGAVVTAVALYGLSYIMASQHTTYIQGLMEKTWSMAENPMAVVGLTLFLGGFFYKLALFPFHFWCPDVYEGTSNETAAYVATVPKLGAVVVLVRLSSVLSPGMEVTNILAILAALSMTIGNLTALVQKDVKRLLGYSSVSHAGYVMLGLVSGTAAGLSAATFYALVYLLMNLTCFYVISRIAVNGENVTLNGLNGLYRKSPGLALVLAVSAFALVGLPPTAGFAGKLFLLASAWDHGYNWLVIVAVLNTAIAIYYYLNLVRHAYTEESDAAAPATSISSGQVAMGGILAACVLLLGVLPAPIYDLALTAGKALLP